MGGPNWPPLVKNRDVNHGGPQVTSFEKMCRDSRRIRQGTSSQYQYCYLDQVIWYYLSAQPIQYKKWGGNDVYVGSQLSLYMFW